MYNAIHSPHTQTATETIDIDIGGSFLDGIGDRIYLFDSGRDCKVWDADELSSSNNYSSGGTTNIDELLKSACPTNSQYLNGQCFCNDGYVASGNTCIKNVICPANSTKIGQSCMCNDGYVFKNSQCVTHTEDCRLTFGDHIVGSKGNAGNSSCNCEAGYIWDSTQTACVKIEVKLTQQVPIPIKSSTEIITPPKEAKKEQAAIKNQEEKKITTDGATTSSPEKEVEKESGEQKKQGFFSKIFNSIKGFFRGFFR